MNRQMSWLYGLYWDRLTPVQVRPSVSEDIERKVDFNTEASLTPRYQNMS